MKMTFKLLAAAVLTSVALAGCGGGDDSHPPEVVSPGQPTPSNSVNALIADLQRLIAGTSEIVDEVDINGLELAIDDTAEPSEI